MKSFSLIACAIIIVCTVVYGRENETREWIPQTHGNANDDGGSCGDNVSWTFTNEGTLSIYGNGPMTDYHSSTPAPWTNHSESIVNVIIEEGVTSIGNYSFSFCSSLTTVDIPSSVSSVGYCAFCNCTALTNVNLPESVVFIGKRAFENCHDLTRIIIPEGVKSLETSVFFRCFSLTKVTIPSGLEKIDSLAFSQCNSLEELIVPDCVKSIGESAFFGCSRLTAFSFPDGVSVIANYSFSGCTSLVEVNIPDSVTKIGMEAFAGCTSLTNVVFPASLESVGRDAFDNCTSLKSIFYLGSSTAVMNDSSSLINLELFCTPSNSSCQQYFGLLGPCFVPSYVNGSAVQRKRINATQWEKKSNGCIIYECDNESGRRSNAVCKNASNGIAQYCQEGRCVVNNTPVNKEGYYYVEIKLQEGIKLNDIIISKLVESLTSQFGIKPGDLTTGFETDDKGNVIRVVLRVEDEYTANSIATLADDCKKIYDID